MIPRRIMSIINDVRRSYPVLAIVGPRQAGKTTLARAAFADKPYVSLENPTELRNFRADPEGFLARFPEGAVLDEVQRAPELPSYLQGIVDGQRSMGMFVLTGSQQLGVMDHITQSLAGRVALLELLPFSHGELRDARRAAETIDAAMLRGSYPPIYDRPVDPSRWYGDYLATYVQRDVRQAVQVRNLGLFGTFLALCAAHAGQQINYQRWSSDLGVDAKTLRGWFSVLEATYVTFRLRPHHRNFRKRVVKTPKLYFVDTGLACRLLDITEPKHLIHHPLRGALYENWVVAELLKGRLQRGLPSNLSYWRSSDGLEVDVLAEQGGILRPVEVKASVTASVELTHSLRKWRGLARASSGEAAVVYGGAEDREIGGIRLIPWHRVDQLADTI